MRGVRLLIASVLLGLLMPATSHAADRLGDLVAGLDAKDTKARTHAYRTLAARRDPAALPLLRRALPAFGPRGRTYGVLVLDRYAFGDVRSTLMKLQKTPDPYLRYCAALRLAVHGETKSASIAIDALRTAGLSESVRLGMVRRLTGREPQEILDALPSLLGAGTPPTLLRWLITFLHAHQVHASADPARALLKTGRREQRVLAAALLYGLGHTYHATLLAQGIVRGMSNADLDTVIKILLSNRQVADPLLAAITRRLTAERNTSCLLDLIAVVGRFRHVPARSTLQRLVHHGDARVARAAFDTLVEMSGSVNEDTLKPLLRGDDVNRRLWAAEAMRKRDDPSGLGVVVFALQSGTIAQRRTAALMLGSFALDMAVEPLLDALEADHVEVRKAAILSLAKVLRALYPYRYFDLGPDVYRASADAPTRTESVRLIRAWWRAHRDADW